MASTAAELPIPPADLAARVGLADGADPVASYLEEGARLRALLDRLVPDDWAWQRKSVLDFGCGSARVLRHFTTEAEEGDFIGCDIDGPSIDWATANLTPPFRFFQNGFTPPLPLETGSLDLIWAMSVFTHISEGWSGWLSEMHRLLAPGGLLLASFLGEGMWEALVGDAYVEDGTGMAVLRGWDGPFAWVLHSEWWLREHWGRAFDFQAVIRPGGAITHSYVVLRRNDRQISPAELERVDQIEAREIAGLQTSLRLARRDIAHLVGREAEIRAAPPDVNRVPTSELGRVFAHRLVNAGRTRLRWRPSEPGR